MSFSDLENFFIIDAVSALSITLVTYVGEKKKKEVTQQIAKLSADHALALQVSKFWECCVISIHISAIVVDRV